MDQRRHPHAGSASAAQLKKNTSCCVRTKKSLKRSRRWWCAARPRSASLPRWAGPGRQPIGGNFGRRSGRRFQLHVPGNGRHASDRSQSVLGNRAHARAIQSRKERKPEHASKKSRPALVEEALEIFNEDIEANRAIGRFGGELIADGDTVLTHCNAGALATAGDYGTALGVIRGAIDAGKRVAVIADETRPFLQGLRLTAWELAKDNIPVTVITDNMAGHVMKSGKDQRGRGGRGSHCRQTVTRQTRSGLTWSPCWPGTQHSFLCRGADFNARSDAKVRRRDSDRRTRSAKK